MKGGEKGKRGREGRGRERVEVREEARSVSRSDCMRFGIDGSQLRLNSAILSFLQMRDKTHLVKEGGRILD